VRNFNEQLPDSDQERKNNQPADPGFMGSPKRKPEFPHLGIAQLKKHNHRQGKCDACRTAFDNEAKAEDHRETKHDQEVSGGVHSWINPHLQIPDPAIFHHDASKGLMKKFIRKTASNAFRKSQTPMMTDRITAAIARSAC
jgi:hypothetical protein